MIALQTFVDRHSPSITEKADSAVVEHYRGHLPNALLELWRHSGFGTYSNGLIQIINPDVYKASLWKWLMRDKDDYTRLPIALSAFGSIFYYRRLNNEGVEDVAFVDPHTSDSSVLSWSATDFFNGVLCDHSSINSVLDQALFNKVVPLKGELAPNEMYYFVPALRLGGEMVADSTERGDALVHLDILLQLALG